MNRIHHPRLITRFTAVLAALAAAAWAAFGTAPAFAMNVPPPGGNDSAPVVPAAVPVQIHTIVTGGMPGWQIALIAAAAALLAATVAVLLERARMARKLHATTS